MAAPLLTKTAPGEDRSTPEATRAWELSGVIWVGLRTSEQGEWFIRHTQSLPGIVPKPDLVNPNTTWDDRMQNITMQVGYTRLLRPSSGL